MQSEPVLMFSRPLAFILEVFCWHLGQGFHGGLQRGRSGNDFQDAFALDNAFDQTFLSGSGEQTPVGFAEFTFAGIVGARQAEDIVSVEQTWGLAAGGSLRDSQRVECRTWLPERAGRSWGSRMQVMCSSQSAAWRKRA